MIAFNEGRNSEALANVTRAIELARKPGVPVSRRFLIAQQFALVQGDLAGASAERLEVLAAAIQEARQSNIDPSEVAEAMNFLAAGYVNLGRLEEADKTYSEALSIYDRFDPADQCDHALVWSGLAGVRRALNRPGEAADLLRKAYAGRLRCWGADDPYTRIQLSFLADALVAMGSAGEGLALLEKESPAWRKPPVNKSLVFSHLKFLAYAYVESGKFQEAEQTSREAFELFGKDQPKTSRRMAGLHLEWARALAGLGHFREALPHAEIAERLYTGRPNEPLTVSNLAKARKVLAEARANSAGR